MQRPARHADGAIFFIDQPPEIEIVDGICRVTLHSGAETFTDCMSVHHLLVTIERFSRAYEEWSAKQPAANCVQGAKWRKHRKD